ncbi:MAG: CBS domain-containing protein [Deltaproteobacteria bacterium]|jgi:CBS domain-containing protein|nr:CBS domain-containing protein [Deltaproteobacteria bacterium]
MPMLVKEVMSKKFITVKPSLNLIELIKLFRTYHFHRLPVTDEENHILGTVSIESVMGIFKPHSKRLTRMLRASPSLKVEEEEMDILDAEITPEWIKTTSVSDLMESNVISIEEDKTISEARTLMKLHNKQGLPVVRNGTLVGVVTLFDIIYALFREKGIIE